MVPSPSKGRMQNQRFVDAEESRKPCPAYSSQSRPMSTLSKTNGRETARRKKGLVKEHDFTLVLSGITELTPEVQDALFDAGCDDATPSMRCGRPFLTFTRAAPTLKDAILSAISDVKKANIRAEVLRIDVCNLVTQSEI